MNAFKTGFSLSMRARQACVNSTGETDFRRTIFPASRSVSFVRSVLLPAAGPASRSIAPEPYAATLPRKDLREVILVCETCAGGYPRRRGRFQNRVLLSNRFHFKARIEDREIFPSRPKLKQIAVVWIVYVAGLPGVIQPHRGIPVFCIDNDLKGAAGGLVISAAGSRYGIAVAPARQRADVELGLQFRFKPIGHEVVNEGMMIGSQLPVVHVRAEASREFRDGFIQALREHRITACDRIGAKAPIRSLQPTNDFGELDIADEVPCFSRYRKLTHLGHKAALPHFINSRGGGIFVENEIPIQQTRPGLLCRLVADLQFAQERDQTPGGDGEVIVLKLNHVRDTEHAARSQKLLDAIGPVGIGPSVVQ